MVGGSTPEHAAIKYGCESVLDKFFEKSSKDKNKYSNSLKLSICVYTNKSHDSFMIVLFVNGEVDSSIELASN